MANRVLIDRAQTGGPGTVNIASDKIYELGNYQSVGTIYDTPDLTFTLDSLDVSVEIEAMLTGQVTADGTLGATGGRLEDLPNGAEIRLAEARPLDVVSEFKPGKTTRDNGPQDDKFTVHGSVAIPYLSLESVSYRFGLTDNATQTVSLRSDSIFYNPSAAYLQVVQGPLDAGDTVVLDNPAIVYRGDTTAARDETGVAARYALSVSKSSGFRYIYGVDYQEAATGAADPATGARPVTITVVEPVAANDSLKVVYASPVTYGRPQTVHAPVGSPRTVRPAAIRGKHIKVYVGAPGAGNPLTAEGLVNDRWTAVQSVTVDWRVTLDRDLEFGNVNVVAQDFDVPDVSGAIEIRPRNYEDLYRRVRQIANVAENEVAGPLTTVPLKVLIVLHNPDTGAPLKSLYIPDARFTFPGYSGAVQQKLNVTLNFNSDSGDLRCYKGLPTDPDVFQEQAPSAPAPTPGP